MAETPVTPESLAKIGASTGEVNPDVVYTT